MGPSADWTVTKEWLEFTKGPGLVNERDSGVTSSRASSMRASMGSQSTRSAPSSSGSRSHQCLAPGFSW